MLVTAFLADSVAIESQKIYAQGAGWNVIRSAAFPARHDRLGIGIIISVPYTATNQQHTMELSLEDEDGDVLVLGDAPPAQGDDQPQKIRKLGANFNVGRPPDLTPGAEQNVPLALNINNLLLEQPGRYRIAIQIDGSEEAVLPFTVVQVQPQVHPTG